MRVEKIQDQLPIAESSSFDHHPPRICKLRKDCLTGNGLGAMLLKVVTNEKGEAVGEVVTIIY
jgi:hypothetical protein